MQGCKDAGMQGCKDSGMQDAGMLGHTDYGGWNPPVFYQRDESEDQLQLIEWKKKLLTFFFTTGDESEDQLIEWKKNRVLCSCVL